MNNSMPTTTKSCAGCDRPFTYQRKNARYCPECRSGVAANRRSEHRKFLAARRKPPLRYNGEYRPACMRDAEFVLERRVPLRDLLLTQDERAVLVAGSKLFEGEMRLAAARHLAEGRYRKFVTRGRLSGGRADADSDLLFAIMDVIEKAHKPTGVFRSIGNRRPTKVEPWTPSEADWGILLNFFLPHELGKLTRARKAAHRTPSLDQPVGEKRGEDGSSREITLAERLEAEEHAPKRPKRGAKLRDKRFRYTEDSLPMTAEMPAEWGYEKHPLDLRLESGLQSNPDVPFTILEGIKRELHEGQPALRGSDLEEQPERAREQQTREAREKPAKLWWTNPKTKRVGRGEKTR